MDERIKELAEKAGFVCWKNERYRPEGQTIDWSSDYDEDLERFADLVRADEREACAKVCDRISRGYETKTDLKRTQRQFAQLAAVVCGMRIREMGKK